MRAAASAPKAALSAIGKVAAVVDALSVASRPVEISRITGLPTSTVHRILQELVACNWAREDGAHGYLLGARLLSIAGRATDQSIVSRIAHPYLRELNERTQHAVHLALRAGDEAVYVDKIEGGRSYHMASRVGLTIPLHSTGVGKAVLAALDDAEVRALLARTGMPARTPHTITDLDALMTELAVIRGRGYAADEQENEIHTCCVAACVIDHRGIPIGALSVSGMQFDFDEERLRQLAPLVTATARGVTEALGGTPVPP